MDPMTIAIVTAVAVVLISLFAFRLFAKETNFEEAYGASALRLLSEEKAGKQKTTRSNRNKPKGSEKKKEKDSGSDKEVKIERKAEEASPSPTPEPVGPPEESVTPEPLSEVKHKKKSKNKHEEVKHVETEQAQLEHKLTTPATETSPVESGRSPQSLVAEGLATKAKKKRARRSSETNKEANAAKDETHVVEEVKQTTTSPLEAPKEEKKMEKTKPKKPVISVKDINPDRLHTRLSSIEELEPEYLSFLASYFSDTGAEKRELDIEMKKLQKALDVKEQLISKMNQQISTSVKKEQEMVQLRQSYAEAKKKIEEYEHAVRTHDTAEAQHKEAMQRAQNKIALLTEQLKKAPTVVHSTPPAVDTTHFQNQIERLSEDLKTEAAKSSQLEVELTKRLQILEQLQDDVKNRDRIMQELRESIASSEKQVGETTETIEKLRQERQALESVLQSKAKAADDEKTVLQHELQTVQTVGKQLERELQTLKLHLVDMQKERDGAISDSDRFQMIIKEMDSGHKTALSSMSAEMTELTKLNNDNKERITAMLKREADELASAQRSVKELREEAAAKSALLDATVNELEAAKKMGDLLNMKVEELTAELEAASQRNNSIDLKCSHCASRLMDKQPPSVCGIEFRPHDEILSPLPTDSRSFTRSTATSPISALIDAGNSYIEPPKTPPKGSSPFAAEVRRTPPTLKKFEPSNAISESDAEEEDLEWREARVHPQAIVCFELMWSVPDWEAPDAPNQVSVTGSFWGWQPARPMSRTNVGFCLQVELPLTCDDGESPVLYAKSDSGRGSPIAGTAHEFKFVVDGEWRCADQYAKVSKDGGFMNNVVYY